MVDLMGYTQRERGHYAGKRVAFNLNPTTAIAFNIWEAKGAFAQRKYEMYSPDYHHIAFNADTHARFDEMCALVKLLGGTILDGPGEFPFGIGGYYAVYFLGPDGLKFEFVHMPALVRS
jgi:catechol 2,3-dioxygenase-like lactoylglutathione lyase family enzyme